MHIVYMLKILVLMYADDTVILAEREVGVGIVLKALESIVKNRN